MKDLFLQTVYLPQNVKRLTPSYGPGKSQQKSERKLSCPVWAGVNFRCRFPIGIENDAVLKR